MASTGALGGTFDPPHLGHLIAAQDVLEKLALDRLLLVPAGIPPHKPEGSSAPAASRARMLRAAVEEDPRLEVSKVELERPGPSYTVDTLRELKARWPRDDLFLVIGVDQLRVFSTWRRPAEVIRLARLVVIARQGVQAFEAAPVSAFDYESVWVPRIDVSSTEIRRRIREGRSIRYWVPEAVRRIIEEEKLYAAEHAAQSSG